MEPHPVRLVVEDDRHRSRLTVFFRLLLAIPHLIWLLFFSIAAFFVAIVNWFATVITGTPPDGLHRFLSAYVRYATHLYAYLLLAANPYPGFAGDRGYPIDVELPEPARQSRWKAGFRLLLALPALLVASTLVGAPYGGGGGTSTDTGGGEEWAAFAGGGAAFLVAFLAWFACLVQGRMPLGFRDLVAYGLRYNAQAWSYTFLLTEAYPDSDPEDPPAREPTPPQAVRIRVEDDLRRSRLTVFFRLLLALPHLVWLTLWGIVAFFAAFVNWFATLFAGRSPAALHRFLSAYLRYWTHVGAFLYLAANPFPGFTGAAGSYPVDLEIDPPERQSRWKTGFRLFLAIPAFFVAVALSGLLFVVAFLGWFAALVTGRMPHGFRNAAAYVLRYDAQMYAYGYLLLTDRYPFSGPAGWREPEPAALEAEPAAA